jgi:hypothetical protein
VHCPSPEHWSAEIPVVDDGTAESGFQLFTRAEFLGNQSATCSLTAGKKLCDLLLQRAMSGDISTISRCQATSHKNRGTRVSVKLVHYNSAISQHGKRGRRGALLPLYSPGTWKIVRLPVSVRCPNRIISALIIQLSEHLLRIG